MKRTKIIFRVFLWLSMAAFLGAASLGVASAKTIPASALTGASSQERLLMQWINRDRIANGLSPLILDAQLCALARMKSQDMIQKNYFAHLSPTYGNPLNMLKTYNIKGILASGENIARAGSLQRAHDGLMKSPGHYRNIMGRFTHIGLGVQVKGNLTYVTEIFVRK